MQIRYRIHPGSEQVVWRSQVSLCSPHLSFFTYAQIEKCSQLFPWCLQNGFKSCPFIGPSVKSAASFSHPFIRHPLVLLSWLLRTVPAWQILPRTQVCLSRSEARESAHSDQCEIVSETSAHFEQCEPLFDSSAHSEKCETCRFETSAYSGKQCDILSDTPG